MNPSGRPLRPGLPENCQRPSTTFTVSVTSQPPYIDQPTHAWRPRDSRSTRPREKAAKVVRVKYNKKNKAGSMHSALYVLFFFLLLFRQPCSARVHSARQLSQFRHPSSSAPFHCHPFVIMYIKKKKKRWRINAAID